MKNGIIVRRIFFFLPFILLLILMSGTYYFYYKYQQTIHKSSTKDSITNASQLVDIIGNFMELPNDETPVMATITDVNKLKEQSFFAHAKNGDKVLIYTKNHEAVLYDPDNKKVVTVGPVFIHNASSSGTMIDTVKKN